MTYRSHIAIDLRGERTDRRFHARVPAMLGAV